MGAFEEAEVAGHPRTQDAPPRGVDVEIGVVVLQSDFQPVGVTLEFLCLVLQRPPAEKGPDVQEGPAAPQGIPPPPPRGAPVQDSPVEPEGADSLLAGRPGGQHVLEAHVEPVVPSLAGGEIVGVGAVRSGPVVGGVEGQVAVDPLVGVVPHHALAIDEGSRGEGQLEIIEGGESRPGAVGGREACRHEVELVLKIPRAADADTESPVETVGVEGIGEKQPAGLDGLVLPLADFAEDVLPGGRKGQG